MGIFMSELIEHPKEGGVETQGIEGAPGLACMHARDRINKQTYSISNNNNNNDTSQPDVDVMLFHSHGQLQADSTQSIEPLMQL